MKQHAAYDRSIVVYIRTRSIIEIYYNAAKNYNSKICLIIPTNIQKLLTYSYIHVQTNTQDTLHPALRRVIIYLINGPISNAKLICTLMRQLSRSSRGFR